MNVGDSHVLVVDDLSDNRDLLVQRLKRLGIVNIAEAGGGAEALEAIANDRFDLVLLDIMMPGLDGFEVLAQLKNAGRLWDLPVLVISALGEIDPVVRCIELGAEDFITKPFNPALMRARILATLEKKFLRDATREELRRKRCELAEARILQMALKPPDFDGRFGGVGLRIETILVPAMEVGGDIVDHFKIDDRLWAFVLGDVADKGAGAALMMARTHALFRSLVPGAGASGIFEAPEGAVGMINKALTQNNERCMFVTVFFAVLDIETLRLRYVRAGHVMPFVRRADGASLRLSAAGGLPLGLDEDAAYKSSAIDLRRGDGVLAVTDGVTEALNAFDDPFGEDRLQRLLDARETATGDLVQALLTQVRAFTSGCSQSDDIAILHFAIGAD